MRTWSILCEEERPIGRLQRLLGSPNQDGSHPMHRATKEGELTESADRSIARRAPAAALGH
jgi:hypothetical protein